MPSFKNTLDQLESKNRLRSLNLPNGIDLTSNDYLGMANHPALREAAINALKGGIDIGAAGSRLLRGHTQSHADLENFAAHHFNSGGALYFANGFQANYALLTTLPKRGDIVLYDSLAHASMRDGLKASDAKSFKFPHNDINALETLLKKNHTTAKQIWIAIETIYSMDGDIAPLNEIYTLAEQYGAYLIADEAHATGIYGQQGKGLCWNIIQKHGYDHLITLHTCGKAIGVAGGLVCASKDIIDYLINTARPFIYTTAPIPLQAYLVQKSLEILAGEDGDKRRDKLLTLCAKGRNLFGGSGTQIIPIIIGSDENALNTAQALQGKGYDIRAIRPPTVPEGTARLRISLSSEIEHTYLTDIANMLESISK
ncbi:MAG: 8-amino-7-oxononanoate synthase [Alphaproteobacteria bacterium]